MSEDRGSPLGLRLVHALFFLGVVTPAAVATSWTELSQLFSGLKGPYVCGAPPLPVPVLGGFLGALSAALILGWFVRGKSAPLWASIIGLVGVACSLAGMQHAAPRKSCVGCNLELLAAARQVHRVQVDALQRTSRVSSDVNDWQKLLGSLGVATPEFRSRTFQQLPLQLVKMNAADEKPDRFQPGDIGLFVSEDGVTFELHPFGVGKDQQLWPLADDRGQPLVLKGVFNPEVPGAGADLEDMAGH